MNIHEVIPIHGGTSNSLEMLSKFCATIPLVTYV